jgi:peptidoglycan/LPS O-acetylase OafA/YrhL
MRFVAATLVLINHTETFYHTAGGTVQLDPLRIGSARIDVFFVISGFVTVHVAHQMRRVDEAASFLLRRFARVFTNYWPIMLVTIALLAVLQPYKLERANFFNSVLLLPTGASKLILPVTWTLTYEVRFYILFAVACLLPRRIVPAAIAVFAGAVLWNRFAEPSVRIPALPSPLVLEFIFGAGVRLLLARHRLRGGLPLVAVAIVNLFLCAYLSRKIGMISVSRPLLVGPAAALLVYAVASLEMRGPVVPERLASLGEHAYSIYLVHWPILILSTVVAKPFVLAEPWSAEIVYSGIVVATIAYAGFHYRFIELPSYRLATRLMKLRGHSSRVTPPTATMTVSSDRPSSTGDVDGVLRRNLQRLVLRRPHLG